MFGQILHELWIEKAAFLRFIFCKLPLCFVLRTKVPFGWKREMCCSMLQELLSSAKRCYWIAFFPVTWLSTHFLSQTFPQKRSRLWTFKDNFYCSTIWPWSASQSSTISHLKWAFSSFNEELLWAKAHSFSIETWRGDDNLAQLEKSAQPWILTAPIRAQKANLC